MNMDFTEIPQRISRYSKQITTIEDQLKQVSINYRTLKFARDIFKGLDNNLDVPVGSYPFEDLHLLAIPVSHSTIQIKEKIFNPNIYYLTHVDNRNPQIIDKVIDINIIPDPISLVKSMNINLLPEPVTIPFNFSGELNGDGHILTYDISDERDDADISVPKSMLKELSKQISPHISTSDMEIDGDHHSVHGTYTFNWPVYLVIPPKSS
ncbi:Hypothetical protein HVR_LOCUS1243 [uncultured virus]|nr:Hypothetical protein HVR_LOCUS1243 [uncultured virus]